MHGIKWIRRVRPATRDTQRRRVSALWLAVLASGVAQAAAPEGLLHDQKLAVGKLTRSYDLYIPQGGVTSPRPIVLLLHGHLGDADVMTGRNRKAAPYKVWLDIAAREKLLLIIPNGERGADHQRGWNDCRADASTNPKTDDVEFIARLLAKVAATYPVDPRRVYATGTSNGGNMVFRLAMEMPDRFAALAPVVAAMPKNSECQTRPEAVSILIMNGTRDPLMPYHGGTVGKRPRDQRGEVLSTHASVLYWTAHNGITSLPETQDLADPDRKDGSRVRVERYRGGRDGSEVVLYEVDGGGHTEPSRREQYGRAYRRIVGPQNHDIEMAEEVWSFFRDKQLLPR